MAVHGANALEDGGVVGESAGGAHSDGLDVESEGRLCGFMRGKRGEQIVENLVNPGGGGDELGGIGGAKVEQGGGGLGDGVDRGASGDVSDVDGGEGSGGEFEFGDLSKGSAEDEDWVWGAGVGP
ncbi:MAG: hypothetical protein JWQ42_3917 [Edaphobacter sp.]|nr:hypothetical protein [Edaphobacter sp.]